MATLPLFPQTYTDARRMVWMEQSRAKGADGVPPEPTVPWDTFDIATSVVDETRKLMPDDWTILQVIFFLFHPPRTV